MCLKREKFTIEIRKKNREIVFDKQKKRINPFMNEKVVQSKNNSPYPIANI